MRRYRSAIVARAATCLIAAAAMTMSAIAQTPPPAVPQGAEARTPDTGPSASEAEITFWNSVKDSRNPAELKAYLDAYPNGAFAALARIRVSALERALQSPPPPAIATPRPQIPPSPPPSAMAPSVPQVTQSAITSLAIIREVYDKLYNLNYPVGTVSDSVTPELRTAISSWQRRLNRPVTGDLTSSDLRLLRSATIPTVWGALAYSARGASHAVWRQPSRLIAETTALNACRRATSNGKCGVVTAAAKGCGAVAHYSGTVGSTRHTGAFAAVRDTLVEASDSAMADCRLKGRVATACKIRNVFCADGSHSAPAAGGGTRTPPPASQPNPGQTKPGLNL